jgi:Fungal specific transcription factor domain
VERLTSSVEQHQMILTRLFGSKDIESLVSLPREELLNLALSKPASMSPTIGFSSNRLDSSILQSDGAESLKVLEQAPESDAKWDTSEGPEQLQGIYDDINGLSLKVDKQSSYVGVSSINAALKVIFKCVPAAKSFVQTDDLEAPNPSGVLCSTLLSPEDRSVLPSKEEGERLIKSFFEKVYPFFPMIDEDSLWADYYAGTRKDNAWYALINAVFALGSLSSGTTESEMHMTYYLRARYNIAPRMGKFHVPNLEVLQVIGMTAGYYLHWLNRPNEADVTMGFALRIALALGLHREYRSTPTQESSASANNSAPYATDWAQETANREQGSRMLSAEIRRRTWWSLFCLDTWASTTTGRPSLGRISEGVTVSEPGKLINVRLLNVLIFNERIDAN